MWSRLFRHEPDWRAPHWWSWLLAIIAVAVFGIEAILSYGVLSQLRAIEDGRLGTPGTFTPASCTANMTRDRSGEYVDSWRCIGTFVPAGTAATPSTDLTLDQLPLRSAAAAQLYDGRVFRRDPAASNPALVGFWTAVIGLLLGVGLVARAPRPPRKLPAFRFGGWRHGVALAISIVGWAVAAESSLRTLWSAASPIDALWPLLGVAAAMTALDAIHLGMRYGLRVTVGTVWASLAGGLLGYAAGCVGSLLLLPTETLVDWQWNLGDRGIAVMICAGALLGRAAMSAWLLGGVAAGLRGEPSRGFSLRTRRWAHQRSFEAMDEA